jgi:hypothetical protein
MQAIAVSITFKLEVWEEGFTVTVDPQATGPLVNQAALLWLDAVIAAEQIETEVLAPIAGLTIINGSPMGATTAFTAVLSATHSPTLASIRSA